MKRIVATLLLLLVGACFGQGPQMGSTLDKHQYDTINLTNLSIMVNIPMRAKPGKMPVSVSLVGTSSLINQNNVWAGTWIRPDSVGAPNEVSEPSYLTVAYSTANEYICSPTSHTSILQGWYFKDTLGVKHFVNGYLFSPAMTGCENPASSAYLTTDGTGYTVDIVAKTVIDRSGNKFANSVWTDPNGNTVTPAYPTGPGNTVVDSLGQIVLTQAISNQLGPYTYNDAEGTTRAFTFTGLQTHPERFNFQCGAPSDDSFPSTQWLTGLTLPDGSAFGFTYEPTVGYPGEYTGRLASITLPTGGTISYQYLGNGGCPNPGVFGGSGYAAGAPPILKRTTSDGTWTYTLVPGTTSPHYS